MNSRLLFLKSWNRNTILKAPFVLLNKKRNFTPLPLLRFRGIFTMTLIYLRNRICRTFMQNVENWNHLRYNRKIRSENIYDLVPLLSCAKMKWINYDAGTFTYSNVRSDYHLFQIYSPFCELKHGQLRTMSRQSKMRTKTE